MRNPFLLRCHEAAARTSLTSSDLLALLESSIPSSRPSQRPSHLARTSDGGGSPEIQFLLDNFDRHPASGGLSTLGFRQYFASALVDDFNDTLADLRLLLVAPVS